MIALAGSRGARAGPAVAILEAVHSEADAEVTVKGTRS